MGYFKRVFNAVRGLKHEGGEITDEMRAQSLELRRMKGELNSLRQTAQIKTEMNDLRGLISGIGETSGSSKEEQLILGLFAQALLGGGKQAAPAIGAPISAPVNTQQNANIAAAIKKKLPGEFQQILTQISDDDLLDIRRQMVTN